MDEYNTPRWEPYGSYGSGSYSLHTRGCVADISANSPRILKCLETVHKIKEGPFVICDYGCADGGVSLPLINACIDVIKKRYGEEQSILVVYEDQPINDFKSLFAYTQGLMPNIDINLLNVPGVSIVACGTNFYKQCLPDSFVHFGLATSAVNWLQERPCLLKESLAFMQSEVEEKMAYCQQAEKDWETFLLHRAKELSSGGKLVMLLPAYTDDGLYYSKISHEVPDLFETLTSILKEMIIEEKITKEELANMGVNFYLRTKAECEAPFLDPESCVSKTGLRLITADHVFRPCPYRDTGKSIKANDVESARKHAQDYVNYIREIFYSFIYLGLNTKRPEDNKKVIMEELLTTFQNMVAQNPGGYGCDFFNLYIEIMKQ